MKSLNPILLVEDNVKDVELAEAAFDENQIANPIVVARDGEEALDYLYKRGRFHDNKNLFPVAVFLDLKLPKVDGHQVLKTIKSDPKLKRIPVIMMTSSKEERDLIESYENGSNAYVIKPIDFDQFTDSVKQLGLFWAVVNEPPPQD
jgi:CheY-like chemotaxis protein